MSQHDLMMEVFRAAGGVDAESVAPEGYRNRIADILFSAEDVIVEVKSLTTDRAALPKTADAVGEMFSQNTRLGAPVVFGTVNVKIADLPRPVADNAMRIVGKRVLKEIKSANQQVKATKAALDRPDALGVLALITPPFKLDRQGIQWLMGDAMREGRCSGIEVVLLVETPLRAPDGTREHGPSFLSLHARGDRHVPPHLLEAIDKAWGDVTGQLGQRADQDDFHRFGATS